MPFVIPEKPHLAFIQRIPAQYSRYFNGAAYGNAHPHPEGYGLLTVSLIASKNYGTASTAELYTNSRIPCKTRAKLINYVLGGGTGEIPECKNYVCNILASYLIENGDILKPGPAVSLHFNSDFYNSQIVEDSHIVCEPLKSTTKCSRCGAALSNEYLECLSFFSTDPNRNICLACLSPKLIQCYECGYYYTNINIPGLFTKFITLGYRCKICQSCYDTRYITCEAGHVYHANWNNDECPFCETVVINEYNFKPAPIWLRGVGEPKNTVKKFFGVELEVEMKPGFEQTKDIVAYRFNQDIERLAYLKKDSSLSCGFEIVTHPGSFSWWKSPNNPLKPAIKKLSATCESFPSATCGTHVHVSKTAFVDPWHIAKFVKFFIANPFFSSYIAERYNSKQSPFVFKGYDIWKSISNDSVEDRHTAINLWGSGGSISQQKTIEIRIFKGNMKWEKIIKNIEFVDAVLVFSREKGPDIQIQTDEELNKWANSFTVKEFVDWVGTKPEYSELYKSAINYKRFK